MIEAGLHHDEKAVTARTRESLQVVPDRGHRDRVKSIRDARAAMASQNVDASTVLEVASALAALGYYTTAIKTLDEYAPGRDLGEEGSLARSVYLGQCGGVEQTMTFLRRLIASRPNQIAAYLRLAELHLCIGDQNAAIAEWREASAISRDAALPQLFLAVFDAELGRSAAPLALILTSAEVEEVIGSIARLLEVRRIAPARALLDGLRSMVDLSMDALKLLAAEFQEAGDYPSAHAILDGLSTTGAPDADLHLRIGNLEVESGNLKAASDRFRLAASIDPTNGSAHINLVKVDSGIDLVACLAQIDLVIEEQKQLTDLRKSSLHAARGEILYRKGCLVEAFDAIDVANRYRQANNDYKEVSALRKIRRIELAAPHAFGPRSAGCSGPRLVFIVGMPRSGSTLCDQILSSHASVASFGEVNFVQRALRSAEPDALRVRFPESIVSWNNADLDVFRANYLRKVDELISTQNRHITHVVDKMLSNYKYIGIIKAAFPDAVIINTRRDPIETCLSCYRVQFSQIPYSVKLEWLARQYVIQRRLMRHWKRTLVSGSVIEVFYERLVTSFPIESRRLLDACGLVPDGSADNFHRNPRPVRTASVMQVRRPLYRDSLHPPRPTREVIRPLLEILEMYPDPDPMPACPERSSQATAAKPVRNVGWELTVAP